MARRTREFWKRLIDEVERGGTIDAVSSRHGVRPRTLVWWRWRMGQGPRGSRRKARLLPVVVRDTPILVERDRVELAVRDVAIRLETGTDVQYIAALVSALRSAC